MNSFRKRARCVTHHGAGAQAFSTPQPRQYVPVRPKTFALNAGFLAAIGFGGKDAKGLIIDGGDACPTMIRAAGNELSAAAAAEQKRRLGTEEDADSDWNTGEDGDRFYANSGTDKDDGDDDYAPCNDRPNKNAEPAPSRTHRVVQRRMAPPEAGQKLRVK